MTEIFAGIRVLDVSQNTFAPAAAGLLADFGADVVRIEHPRRATSEGRKGYVHPSVDGVDLGMAQSNRGKRSVGLDLATPQGADVLARLVGTADVFLTNFLIPTAQKLGIDEAYIRGMNPRIVYARATGQGPRGPEADTRAYDATAYWARGGVGASFARGDRPPMPLPSFGDRAGSMNLAFGITAALLRRERTGEGGTVDVSLLGTALWQNSSTTTYAMAGTATTSRERSTNPLSRMYETSDQRWLIVTMLDPDRFWPDFCDRLGRPDLAADDRYRDASSRARHADQLVDELGRVFRSATLAGWRTRFATLEGAWAPLLTALEAAEQPQAGANGYVAVVDQGEGRSTRLLPPPVQFDGAPPRLGRPPAFGDHGDEVLLDLGYTKDDIAAMREVQVLA
jgi:crotonobetainyl-CoA:carnitine CoA-transferase CaiB-like acyl-CoA transferase